MPKSPKRGRLPTRDEGQRATTIVLSAIVLVLIVAILIVLAMRGYH
jgi:hypothetical protein